MRLTDLELTALREELNAVDPFGRANLFGSRVDDHRKGGEKVDLIVRNPGQPEQPIHAIARKGILL